MKRFFFLLLFTIIFYPGFSQSTLVNYFGFLYTSTNADAGNGIIALGRKANGTLTELPGSPYLTGGRGDAAKGDSDTQWALRFVGDYLLAVNAGANPVNGSISVFEVNRTDGSLARVDQDPATTAMDNMDSRGIRATSIATAAINGTTWVVVGNQHSLAGFEKDPPKPTLSRPTRLRQAVPCTELPRAIPFHLRWGKQPFSTRIWVSLAWRNSLACALPHQMGAGQIVGRTSVTWRLTTRLLAQ